MLEIDHPDLALLDFDMPGMSGHALLLRLRERVLASVSALLGRCRPHYGRPTAGESPPGVFVQVIP